MNTMLHQSPQPSFILPTYEDEEDNKMCEKNLNSKCQWKNKSKLVKNRKNFSKLVHRKCSHSD